LPATALGGTAQSSSHFVLQDLPVLRAQGIPDPVRNSGLKSPEFDEILKRDPLASSAVA
jgi:hypothetical protein